jgi:soluble lytic murein transglycosylase-like protein
MRVGERAKGVHSRAWGVRRASFALVLLGSVATTARAELYYYLDGEGAYHFTNSQRPGTMPFVFERPLADLSAVEPKRPSTDTRAAYDDVILESADRYRVDPALVRAVIQAESGFNRLAISPKGARGLMQLMPATARQRGCRNPFDAGDNVHAGVEHLRVLLDEHGENLPRALAAYNAGSSPVARYRGIPPYAETEQYVARVLRLRRNYLRKQRLAR